MKCNFKKEVKIVYHEYSAEKTICTLKNDRDNKCDTEEACIFFKELNKETCIINLTCRDSFTEEETGKIAREINNTLNRKGRCFKKGEE
uniref:Uncharacterized protein n=1 Tax=viral metagenome TaxID=1070528 RepID=A0A6M3KTM4_9ZZZZ